LKIDINYCSDSMMSRDSSCSGRSDHREASATPMGRGQSLMSRPARGRGSIPGRGRGSNFRLPEGI